MAITSSKMSTSHTCHNADEPILKGRQRGTKTREFSLCDPSAFSLSFSSIKTKGWVPRQIHPLSLPHSLITNMNPAVSIFYELSVPADIMNVTVACICCIGVLFFWVMVSWVKLGPEPVCQWVQTSPLSGFAETVGTMFWLHCILHQEMLCCKSWRMDHEPYIISFTAIWLVNMKAVKLIMINFLLKYLLIFKTSEAVYHLISKSIKCVHLYNPL